MKTLNLYWHKLPRPLQNLAAVLFFIGLFTVSYLAYLGLSELVIEFGSFLDKQHLKKIVLYNFFSLFGVGLSVYLIFYIRKKRNLRETAVKLFKFKYSKFYFGIILAYFIVGTLDLIYIHETVKADANQSYIKEISLLDVIFSEVAIERDYSAPFASTTLEGDHKVNGVHVLGTDQIGNDVLFLTLKGCSTALLLAFGSCLILFPLAIFFGLVSGYFGGWIDDIIIWLYTTISSMPFLLFIIALTIIKGKSLENIIFAFGITSWVGTCRLIRAETLKFKKLDFILATKVLGGGTFRLLFKHITPNLMHIIVIKFSLLTSHFIIAESILSFLGIGLDVGSGSWGAMISRAQDELLRDPTVWWPFIAAGFIGIFPLVLALNMFGDIVRDALDPKLNADI